MQNAMANMGEKKINGNEDERKRRCYAWTSEDLR